MQRVAFVPAGVPRPGTAVELGTGAGGSWIACDDDVVLAGAGQLELLWLSRAAYDHAVRKLAKEAVPKVIALRRTGFSAHLPSLAKAELFPVQLRVLAVAARDPASDAFAHALTLLTRLAGASRFQGIGDAGLLERLLEREQAVRNELRSPEGRPEAAPGEQGVRTGFVDDTAQLLKHAGRPDYAQAPLHVPLVRGYLLKPAPARLVADWERDGVAAVPWRGGVIGPLRADEAAELRSSLAEVKLMFPDGDQAAELSVSLTPAQLTVALREQEQDLHMTPHVAGLRVALATFRRNAASLVTDASIAARLATQVAAEAPLVMAAFAARPAFVEPARPPSLSQAEADFVAAAALLSRLVARQGVEWQALAAELLAIANGS